MTNSGWKRPDADQGGGLDYYAQPFAPEDTVRLRVVGDAYPRIVLDAVDGAVLVGNGAVAATALGVGSSTDVKSYGAVGNGTTDDTAAINAAIAGTPAGGALHFPVGRYLTQGGHAITTPMLITGTGRNQTFDSSAQLYLKQGANADLFTLSAPNITMRDLALYGNYPGQSATSRGIVFSVVTGANYTVLDNVWIDSFNGDGIVLQGPTNSISVILSNVESRLNRRYGIEIAGASDVEILGGYVDQNVNSGIHTTGSALSVSNMHIWGNGTGASGLLDGVTMESSSGNRFVNCYIESNTNGRGIYARTGTLNGHQIIGNYLYNNGYNGIYCFTTTHSVISGNHIYKNNFKSAAAGSGAGILLESCTAIVTTNNVLRDLTTKRQTYGYFELTAATDCVFANNVSRAADHVTGNWSILAGGSPTLPATPASYNVG